MKVKEYTELTFEERKIVWKKYQELCKIDKDIDTFENFEEFNGAACWTNLDYDANTLEAL